MPHRPDQYGTPIWKGPLNPIKRLPPKSEGSEGRGADAGYELFSSPSLGGPPYTPPPGTESWWPTDIDPSAFFTEGDEEPVDDPVTGKPKVDPKTGEPITVRKRIPWTAAQLLNYARSGGMGPDLAARIRDDKTAAQKAAEASQPPELIEIGGQQYVRNPATGSLQPLDIPSYDETIVKAIADGDWELATYLRDFRNEPSDIERFQAALDYAKAPTDSFIISAIARGIQAGPSTGIGDVQRLGPPPSWLTDAYNRLFGKRPTPPAKKTGPLISPDTLSGISPPETTAAASAHVGRPMTGSLPPPPMPSTPETVGATPFYSDPDWREGPQPVPFLPPEGEELSRQFFGTHTPQGLTPAQGAVPVATPQPVAPQSVYPREMTWNPFNPDFWGLTFNRTPIDAYRQPLPSVAPQPFAKGGTTGGGPIMVGERGPELIPNAPPGLQVQPIDPVMAQMLQMSGTPGYQAGGVIGRPPQPTNPYNQPMVLVWDTQQGIWQWVTDTQASFIQQQDPYRYEYHGLQNPQGSPDRTRAAFSAGQARSSYTSYSQDESTAYSLGVQLADAQTNYQNNLRWAQTNPAYQSSADQYAAYIQQLNSDFQALLGRPAPSAGGGTNVGEVTPTAGATPPSTAPTNDELIAEAMKLPAIQALLAGSPIPASRSLFAAAGLRPPSQQGWGNLLPSEQESFRGLGSLLGFTPEDFEHDLRSGFQGAPAPSVSMASRQRPRRPFV